MTHPADKFPPFYFASMAYDGSVNHTPYHTPEQLRQAYDADRPQWKDAPNVPGMWFSIEAKGQYCQCYEIADEDLQIESFWRDGSRYFGPISEDKK